MSKKILHSKQGTALRKGNRPTRSSEQRMRLHPLYAAVVALMPAIAGAEIVVDPNAAQRAGMNVTANGTPLVNIVNPNQRGISHNQFQKFNVDPNGVVFNNSMKDGVSAIGGLTMNNPNLSNQARAIIGEVTGPGTTGIRGAMEVFGGRADLIIANPNGISVNGASTINANSLTLSTGKVLGGPDGAMRLGIEGGMVGIEGAGISTEGLSHFDIVSRTAQINGEINGPANVKVVAGQGEYDPATRTHVAKAGAKAEQAIAIDGSQLGSMYGGMIELVATDSGAGVRHEGVILGGDNIRVTADGDIVLGAAQSKQGGIALAGRNVSVQGTPDTGRIGLIADKDIDIRARQGASIKANLESSGNMGIGAGGNVDVTGDLLSRGKLGIDAGGSAGIAAGLASQGDLSVKAGGAAKVDGSLLSYGDVSVDAGGSVSGNANMEARGKLAIRAGDSVSTDGQLLSHGDGVSVVAGTSVDLNGETISKGQVSIDAGTSATIDGRINSISSVAIRALKAIGVNADVISHEGTIAIDAESLIQTAASILTYYGTAADLSVPAIRITVGDYRIDGTLYAINAKGEQIADARVVLRDGRFVVEDAQGALIDDARVASTAQVGATAGDVKIVATQVQNAGGALIAADGALVLDVAELFRNAGMANASGKLDVAAATFQNTGYLGAGSIDVAAKALSNAGGMQAGTIGLKSTTLDNSGVLNGTSLTAKAGSIDNSGAILGTKVGLETDSLDNSGLVSGSETLGLDVARRLDNAGTVQTGGDLALKGLNTLVNRDGGRIQGQNVSLTDIGSIDNKDGAVLLAGGALGIDKAGSLSNSGATIQGNTVEVKNTRKIENKKKGAIQAAKTVTLEGADSLLNDDATLAAGETLALRKIKSVTNTAGTIASDGRVAIDAVEKLINSKAATIVANKGLSIDAKTLANDASRIQSGADATISATDLDNTGAGIIVAGGDLSVDAETLDNAGSRIQAGGDAKIGATDLNNTGKSLISSDANLGIDASKLKNADGAMIHGETSLALSGDAIENRGAGSQISSSGKLTAKAKTVLNTDGALMYAQKELGIDADRLTNEDKARMLSDSIARFTADQIANTGKAQMGSDGGRVTVEGKSSIHNDSAVIVGGSVDFSGKSLVNEGDVEATDNVNIDVDTLDNEKGTVWAGDTLAVSVKDDLVFGGNAGALNSGKLLDAKATGDITVDQTIENLGSIRLRSGKALTNNAAIISANGVALGAKQIRNSKDSLIWAMKDVSLDADEWIHNERNANILSQDTLSLVAPTILNEAGTIRSEGDMAIDARDLRNLSAYTGQELVEGPDSLSSHGARFKFRAAQRVWVQLDIALPTLTSNLALDKSAEISAGGNLFINQRNKFGANAVVDGKRDFDSVLNEGGLIAAGKNLYLSGDVVNQPKFITVDLYSFMTAKRPKKIKMDASKNRDEPVYFESMYHFIDFLWGGAGSGNYWYDWYRGDGDPQSVFKQMEGPTLNLLMSTLFGPTWRAMSNGDLSKRWRELKADGDAQLKDSKFYLLPQEKSAITAGGNVVHEKGTFDNGLGGVRVENKKINVKVGDKEIDIVAPTYDVSVNPKKFEELEMGISTLPALKDLTSIKGMFSRSSAWLSKKGAQAAGDATGLPGGQGGEGLANNGVKVVPMYETRLKFIDQSKFYGSDYFFQQIGYNSEIPVNVIGDNYFVTELIRRQMNDSVGAFFAVRDGVQDAELVKMLMGNAADVEGLEVGKALSKEQMASLDKDIVWFVSETIDGEAVMVPRVYLAQSTLTAMRSGEGDGAALVNAGGTISIDAERMQNASGSLTAGKDVVVRSKGDLSNVSAGMSGGIAAGGHVNLISTEGSVINNGAAIKAGGDITLLAEKGNIDITASAGYDEAGKLKLHEFDDGINAGKDVNIYGKNVTLNSASIKAGNDANIVATEGDLRSNEMHEADSSYYYERTKGVLNFTMKESSSASATGVGSSVQAGGALNMGAKNDITLEGGKFSGESGNMVAGNKIDVKTTTNYSHETDKTTVSQFGISAGAKALGFEASAGAASQTGTSTYAGVSDRQNPEQDGNSNSTNAKKPGRAGVDDMASVKFGYSRTTESSSKSSETHNNTNLSFGEGGLSMSAGTVDMGGANIKTTGTLDVKADDIQTTKYVDRHSSTESKSSVMVGTKGEVHSVLADAANKYGELGNAAAKEGNKTDAGMTTLQVIGDISNVIFNDLAGASVTTGVSVSGGKTNQSTWSENENHIEAGKINMQARNDIDLKGVKMKADEANLDAGGELRMGTAQSGGSQDTTGYSVKVGASAGAWASLFGSGVGVSVDASGTYDGSHAKWTQNSNTTLDANKVNMRSGGDTTLAGANVNAKDVSVKTGGKLNIESVQDTVDYNRKKANAGLSAGAAVGVIQATGTVYVIPTFSVQAGGGTEHRTERTTAAQSGIKGSDSLNVETGGDLNLKGGHLISDAGKGTANIGGSVNAENVNDKIDQDGGYGGGGFGISRTGMGTVSAWGETVDDVDKQTRQNATIAGVSVTAGGVNGDVNAEAGKATQTITDKTTTGNKLSFTAGIGDITKIVGKKKGSFDLPTETGGTREHYTPIDDSPAASRRGSGDGGADLPVPAPRNRGGNGDADGPGRTTDFSSQTDFDDSPGGSRRSSGSDPSLPGNGGGGRTTDFTSQTDFDDGPGQTSSGPADPYLVRGRVVEKRAEVENRILKTPETAIPLGGATSANPGKPADGGKPVDAGRQGGGQPDNAAGKLAGGGDQPDNASGQQAGNPDGRAEGRKWPIVQPPERVTLSPGSSTGMGGFNGAREMNTNTGKSYDSLLQGGGSGAPKVTPAVPPKPQQPAATTTSGTPSDGQLVRAEPGQSSWPTVEPGDRVNLSPGSSTGLSGFNGAREMNTNTGKSYDSLLQGGGSGAPKVAPAVPPKPQQPQQPAVTPTAGDPADGQLVRAEPGQSSWPTVEPSDRVKLSPGSSTGQPGFAEPKVGPANVTYGQMGYTTNPNAVKY
ncbi:two-partner secretion domain-containing protein [Cupriavidus agavae]|uniref:Filamentous hemagglutinin n=1 Tax=Cupriavidus agavae TaxID=1001822 RepID=A0A4Q7SCP4_9BURK|nr:hemagglutinin repeat-containing protein [Cupriavidus agavae]RZT42932.1 filamentous hemagglutinin [Cupriavidus agavae]